MNGSANQVAETESNGNEFNEDGGASQIPQNGSNQSDAMDPNVHDIIQVSPQNVNEIYTVFIFGFEKCQWLKCYLKCLCIFRQCYVHSMRISVAQMATSLILMYEIIYKIK